MKSSLINYLRQKYVMQVATASGDRPWSCTVYYVVDDELNLYWASIPQRRHSQEIASNKNIAVSIPIQHEKDRQVIGIQAEGRAKVIEGYDKIKPIAKKYASSFGRNEQWVEDFSSLKTDHKLYKFVPDKYVLFDEENYPDSPRQEVTP